MTNEFTAMVMAMSTTLIWPYALNLGRHGR